MATLTTSHAGYYCLLRGPIQLLQTTKLTPAFDCLPAHRLLAIVGSAFFWGSGQKSLRNNEPSVRVPLKLELPLLLDPKLNTSPCGLRLLNVEAKL